MPSTRNGVYPTTSFCIRTNPNTSAHILSHTENGTGTIRKMPNTQRILIHHIEPVFVSTYPKTTVLVDKRTGNAIAADEILVAKSLTHISKSQLCLWLHEESLMQKANPNVTIAVFQDRTNLTLFDVHISCIIWIVNQRVILRVILEKALSVTSN